MTDIKQTMPFVVMIAILVIMAVIVIHLMNYRLKKRILDAGPLDQVSLRFFTQLTSRGSDILKWGIILLFGGVGLMVLEFLPYRCESSPLPYGVEMVFLALGFLCFYLIMRKENKND